MLIRVILIFASALTAFWLLMLMAVSSGDWDAARRGRLADIETKTAELRRKDAANAAKLEEYHGVPRFFMGLVIGGTSEKEIAKLEDQRETLEDGRPKGISVLAMPGYTIQRVFPSIGNGALHKDVVTKCVELYGKKFGQDKARQVLAGICSYPVIGIAISLALGAASFASGNQTMGIALMSAGSLIVFFLAYAIYDDVGDKLNKRRAAISRQFPNVVSKLALLATSGMNMDRAWRETALSREQELYQEMKKTARDLAQNMPPSEAYANFIDRCNTKETTKLASAILQNQTKGNREIGLLLKSIAHEAWQERQHTARRDSEAANSKLMIPTILLFLAIMIMIMVPIAIQFNQI